MTKRVKKLVITAFFVAIILAFAFFNIGIIPIPPANVTIMHLPVIIGALLCGPATGLLLGAVFGATSVLVALRTPSLLVAPLMAGSPLLVIVMSVLPRLLIPLVSYSVYRAMSKKHGLKLSAGVSAACGSLTNTVGYLGLMLVFYALCGIDNAAVLAVVAGAGALNGSLEAVAAVIITVPLVAALTKFVTPGAGLNNEV